MGLPIITADERMKETKGVKALVLGPPGIGKTSLMRTLDADKTLFLDFEAGALSIEDVKVDMMRPKTWEECRDLVCFLSGPDMDLRNEEHYSERHYDAVCEKYGDAHALDKYDTFFVDSLTVAGRVCLKWAGQQPDSFNKNGEKDNRGMYGLYGREMLDFISRLQHVRNKNVIFVAILESAKDEFGRVSWEVQVDGQKVGRELPGIVDEVFTLQRVPHPKTEEMVRGIVTDTMNEWGYPAKDRSGKLKPIEKPHLGDIIAKINTPKSDAAGSSAKTTPATSTATQEMEAA